MSWLIAIFGLATCGYLIIYKYNQFNYLMSAFLILLGSLLLAAIIRMFGNIGQLFFDLKTFIEKILPSFSNELHTLNHGLVMLGKDVQETRQTLTQGLTTLNQDLKTQFQSQTTALVENLLEVSNSMKSGIEQLSASLTPDLKAVTQNLNILNQDLKTQFQSQTTALIKNLEQLSASLSNSLQAVTQDLTILNQDLEVQFQNQTVTLVENLLEVSNSMKSNFEQVNGYSKDINQNIQQIKIFFEQIERHLDFKK
jgi:4-hydroxy-3-methylbut-2-enyl diphosphate reductase IspH